MTRPDLPPPVAPRRPSHIVVHGITLHDDYAWLKADNWQEVLRSPAALPGDIKDYLLAENRYGATVLAAVADLQETITAEMRARVKEDDSSVPSPDGPYSYLVRYRQGE